MKVLLFILLSSAVFGQQTTTDKLQEMANKIDSLITVNLDNYEISDYTLAQIDSAIAFIREIITAGTATSNYTISDIDGTVNLWKNVKSDSTQCTKGQIYRLSNGTLRMKY